MRPTVVSIFLLLFVLLAASSCRYPTPGDHWAGSSENEIDSVEFRASHHYWRGYNFMATDTFRIFPRPPFAPELIYSTDTSLIVRRHDVLVVEDIAIAPDDTTAVWAKVTAVTEADDYGRPAAICSGWVREPALLSCVVPDTPISKCIHGFSNRRFGLLFCSIGLAVLFGLWQTVRRLRRQGKGRRAPLFEPCGAGSFYPTLLCLSVSTAAVLYQSMQVYVPETWVEFYFHPTLNPFHPDLPPVLSLFVAAIWELVVVAVAVLYDLNRRTDLAGICAGVAELGAACLLLYLVFTLLPVQAGYVLLPLGWWIALRQWWRGRMRYLCGHCGQPLPAVGRCPHCGADND